MFRAKHLLIGYLGESLAGLFLSGKKYRFLARNEKIAGGEIDLIYLDGSCLVFVEVKTVAAQSEEDLDRIRFQPEMNFTPRKLVTIKRVAGALANGRFAKLASRGWRLDLVAIVVPKDLPGEVTFDFLSRCLVRHYKNVA